MWGAELGRLFYAFFAFTARLHPEAIRLTCAFPMGRLLSDEAPGYPAAIGARDFMGDQRNTQKLSRRKNARNGITSTRHCFCGESAQIPRRNSEIRGLRANVILSTTPGDRISPY